MGAQRKRLGRSAALAGVVAAATTLAACSSSEGGEGAEDFPTEQIEFIVPLSAGGGTDQIARKLAQVGEETCGTDIVVTNRTGGSGTVGLQSAISANPDGYTVGLATSSTLLSTHFGVTDITPDDLRAVMQFNFDPSVLSVNSDSPYDSIDEFLAAADSGETIRVGTSGSGSIWQLSFVGMAVAADVPPMTNVPYEGAAPAIVAVLGGDAHATSVSGVEARAQIESGELKPLASMSQERLPFLPDTPTLLEEGIDWTSGVWRGLVVPPETPDNVVNTLNDCFKEAYDSEEFQSFMDTQGFGLEYKDAEEFDASLREEFENFGQLVNDLNIQ